MNIAIISYHGCPVARLGEKDTGGMNVYVLNMAKELSNLGNNVDVFTRRHDITDPQIVSLSEKSIFSYPISVKILSEFSKICQNSVENTRNHEI